MKIHEPPLRIYWRKIGHNKNSLENPAQPTLHDHKHFTEKYWYLAKTIAKIVGLTFASEIAQIKKKTVFKGHAIQKVLTILLMGVLGNSMLWKGARSWPISGRATLARCTIFWQEISVGDPKNRANGKFLSHAVLIICHHCHLQPPMISTKACSCFLNFISCAAESIGCLDWKLLISRNICTYILGGPFLNAITSLKL